MNFIQLQFKSSALKKHERDKDPPQLYLNLIRECYRTLYVGMAQGVSFSLYIGIGAKLEIRRKPAKEGYVQLNIERSYYKLTLKASGYWSGTVVSRLLVPIAICSLHSITRHVINEHHSSSFRIQNSNCVSTVRTKSAHAIRILNTK